MERFAKKAALVTGAASGVGRATAQRLGAEGATIYGADIDEAGLEQTRELLAAAGGSMQVGRFDLSSRDGCHAAVAAAADACGRLDVVVNCAGISSFDHFVELSEERWDRILDINLKGTAFTCQAAIPHLLESKGCIVNVASVAGLIGQAYTVAYCASKGAVVQLTRALAMEFVKREIRVNAVAPGGINTAMNENIRWPEEMDWRLVKPYMSPRGLCESDEIAAAIAYLASDEARYVHGAILSIDGGVVAG